METSNNSTVQSIGAQLTFFQEAIHASLTARPEQIEDSRIIDISGLNTYESLKLLGLPSLSMKMFPAQLLTGSWIKRLSIWKLRATPAGRPCLFLRVLRVPYIEGIGYGWLPTPMQSDHKHSANNWKAIWERKKINPKAQAQLTHFLGRLLGADKKRNSLQMNSRWLEQIMGYPKNWTQLPPSETQSFRKSRSKSSKQ